MLSRLLVLLLLAANLGVGAWLFLTPRVVVPAPVAADPGVAPLVLLSEREGATSPGAEELTAAPEAADAARDDRCLSLGPFPTQSDLRRAVNALTPAVKRTRTRESRTTQSRGFLVYLPAPASREQALSVARELYGRGVRDYYVVTAGGQQNTISLGLFRDRNNAERRRAEIAAMGFTPAITERLEELPVYWLDFAVSKDSAFNWRDRLPDLLGVDEQAAACF
jgi:cell division septation protein DedD